MATWDDVRRIALGLPDVAETTVHGMLAWKVHDRLFVWERPLRKSDLAALGDAAPAGEIVGARVESEIAKRALIEDSPDIYFTIPHFDGYNAILALLERIDLAELEELIVEAWLLRAPRRIADEYARERGLPTR